MENRSVFDMALAKDDQMVIPGIINAQKSITTVIRDEMANANCMILKE
jgi:hypothetical protein